MQSNMPIRWGIIGTGTIAKKFATALNALGEAKLVAVGSRSQATAEQFGDQFGVAHRHGSYEALVNDPEVDAVYVATPHSAHKDNALAALSARKAVLVEKPFTINSAEAQAVIDFARAQNLLVMEAMWTRFLPLYVRLREMIADGSLGEVRLVTADFGFKAGPTTNRRLLDPALGGGALLDIGVYPVSLASMVFGSPSAITGATTLGPTGVDEQSAIILQHPRGEMAVLSCTIQANTSMEIAFHGTKASLRIHAPAWKSTAMTLTRDGAEELLKFPFESNGFQFEAVEFMHCLRAGKTESAIMPLDETLAIMHTMDVLRAQWGLQYPMENKI
jgi:predicted dehydrogenase